MKRLLPLWLPLVLLTVLQGSVTVAAEGEDAARRIDLLERKVRALSDLVSRLDRLEQEVRQLRGDVELQNHALDKMQRHQRELYLDLDQRLRQGAGQVAADQSELPAAPVEERSLEPSPVTESTVPSTLDEKPKADAVAPPAVASAKEEKAYRQAFELLSQRRYDEASSAFQQFLVQYPHGAYADNAQYWLAEVSYVTRQFETALAEFEKVLKLYPDSPKVPGALLKTGYIQYDQQQQETAKETLQGLIKRFPASSAARLAQEFIRRKGL